MEEGGEAGLGAKIGRRNRLPKGPQFQDDERTIRAGDQNRLGRASESVSRLFLRRACGRVRACACRLLALLRWWLFRKRARRGAAFALLVLGKGMGGWMAVCMPGRCTLYRGEFPRVTLQIWRPSRVKQMRLKGGRVR